MKMDYIPTQTLEEAESQWGTDRVQFGHYDDIFYDCKEGLLFRESYLPRGNGGGGKKKKNFLLVCRFIRGIQLAADLEGANRLDIGFGSMAFFTPMGS